MFIADDFSITSVQCPLFYMKILLCMPLVRITIMAKTPSFLITVLLLPCLHCSISTS